MNPNGFNIDLTNVSVMQGGSLPAGKQLVRIAEAEMKDVSGGARMIFLNLEGITHSGRGRDRFTIGHPRAASDNNAKTAVEIGFKKLKSILTFGRDSNGVAPDANNFSNISQLIGLTIGVDLEIGQKWTGQDGKEMDGFAEVVGKGRPYYGIEEMNVILSMPQPSAPPASAPSAAPAPSPVPAQPAPAISPGPMPTPAPAPNPTPQPGGQAVEPGGGIPFQTTGQ